MQVVILAGGLATRMRPLSETLPKSLFPVAGRPFIDWQLEALATAGATRVVLCVRHFADSIRAHLASRTFGPQIVLAEDGERPCGTGGALREVARRGLLADDFLVTYGDSFLPVNFRPLLRNHVASGLDATMAVFRNRGQWDASNVVVDDGLVTRYEKIADPAQRPPAMQWIDFGVTAFNRRSVLDWDDSAPFDLAAPLGRLARARRLAAHEYVERFYEIGSPEGLAELDQLLSRVQTRSP